MDADLFAEAIEYELLTQAVYKAILRNEGNNNIDVKHNTNIKGRSGIEHQVDVSWRFRQAALEHHVLIECKNFGTALTLEKIRNFFAVLHDIGNCKGVMVTKTGYQAGVVDFAKYYGIDLKLLRAPTTSDWEGRIKDIHIRLQAVVLASGLEKAPRVEVSLSGDTPQPIKDALSRGDLTMPPGPEIVFVDANGIPISDKLRSWLPRTLAKDNNLPGGPYTKVIPLKDHFIQLRDKNGATSIAKIEGMKITYYYEVAETREFTIYGEMTVDAILKDFSSGNIEHVHRKKDADK